MPQNVMSSLLCRAPQAICALLLSVTLADHALAQDATPAQSAIPDSSASAAISTAPRTSSSLDGTVGGRVATIPSSPLLPSDGAGAPASAPRAGSDAASGQSAEFAARQAKLDRRSAENQYRYDVAQHNCYSHFFVNHCLGTARDTMRAEKSEIRVDQLALDEEQRAVHAQQRDENTAVRLAQDTAAAPQHAANEKANQATYEEKQRQHQLDAASRGATAPAKEAANQAEYDKKQADFQAKLDQAHNNAAQDAAQRAHNVGKFDDKQRAAAEHQETVKQRQAKAATAAAASQAAAANAASAAAAAKPASAASAAGK